MKLKRIFIAVRIDPEETLKKMISAFKSVLKDENIKWTNQENMHLTLAFLGDTEEKQINVINSMMTNSCEGFGRFELKIKGAGVFKNLNDPRVIWAGIDISERLNQLNSLIKTGLDEAGTKMEERLFRPHLTLARIKHINPGNSLKDLIEKYRDTELQVVTVNEIILYESILLPQGPVYKPVSIYKI